MTVWGAYKCTHNRYTSFPREISQHMVSPVSSSRKVNNSKKEIEVSTYSSSFSKPYRLFSVCLSLSVSCSLSLCHIHKTTTGTLSGYSLWIPLPSVYLQLATQFWPTWLSSVCTVEHHLPNIKWCYITARAFSQTKSLFLRDLFYAFLGACGLQVKDPHVFTAWNNAKDSGSMRIVL